MKDDLTCLDCGFWDSDCEGCTCPAPDKIYACPMKNDGLLMEG